MRQGNRSSQKESSQAAGERSRPASASLPRAQARALVVAAKHGPLPGEAIRRWGAILRRLVRSAIAGGLATVVDLGVLMGLVSLAAWTARSASVPALVAGAVAAFVAQKYYAFEAVGGPVVRQATQFALVQVGSAVLTGVFYDLALVFAPSLAPAYVIVRLVTSNIVWLAFSFPLWHVVFRVEPRHPDRKAREQGASDLHPALAPSKALMDPSNRMCAEPRDPKAGLRRAPPGLPPRIRSDASNAFAHHTMAVRVPAILDDVLHGNPDYAPGVCERIRALRDALREDQRFAPLDPDLPHAQVWQEELAERRGEGWLSSDWFFAENHAYRRLADAVEFWQTGRDPFAPTKRAEYGGRAHREALEAGVAIAGPDALERLLLADVFANRMDLSFAASRERGTGASGADLLSDDRALACERLRRGPGAVHFVIDNAGTELSLDLVLAARLIEELGAAVVLHVKVHPAFVSDAIEHDVRWFLAAEEARAAALWGECSAAARSLRALLQAELEAGGLRIAPHPFWNGPASLWDLPDELGLEFAGARLVILKGDAHYRRAVGDALWAPETPFAMVTRYFPAPLLALRTLKSDAIVGLPQGIAARLDVEDPRWRVNGQRGVASLGGTSR